MQKINLAVDSRSGLGVLEPRAFFTVEDLAVRWFCCEESIRRQIRRGELRSILRARKHLIPTAEVERVEANN